MARMFLTISTIVFLTALVGCTNVDSGKTQLAPSQKKVKPIVNVATTAETDIVEKMAVNRQAYRNSLETLVEYYKKTGNNMKLDWAKKELGAFDTIPQYTYIIEASVAGPELKATASIPEADELYAQALALSEKSGFLIKNDTILRQALDKYNLLIKKYPTSDKIDDAAFKAAYICLQFQDYPIALLYLQRTYQWDPETPHPARFEAAYVLDQYMHRRAEALEAYNQALKSLKNEYEFPKWKQAAEKRIAELTKSDKAVE